LTSIAALADSGLSADTTLAPGTQGISLLRSLMVVQAESGFDTENVSFNVGILRSLLCRVQKAGAIPGFGMPVRDTMNHRRRGLWGVSSGAVSQVRPPFVSRARAT
jgi:hypothetical protein